jgi:hypothetical protein
MLSATETRAYIHWLQHHFEIPHGHVDFDTYGCVVTFGWHRGCGHLLFALLDHDQAVAHTRAQMGPHMAYIDAINRGEAASPQ